MQGKVKAMKKWLCILIIAATALSLAACSEKEESADNPDGMSVGHVTQTETIYLGVLLPLSGNMSVEAAKAKAAMETAVDIINDSHDIDWDIAQNAGLAKYGNAKLELRFADCGNTTVSCLAAVGELIDLGVTAIIGAYDPYMTASAAIVCKNKGVPMICGSAKSNRLSDGSYALGDGFVHIAMSIDQETQLFLEYINQINIKNDLGIKKTAIAYADNSSGNDTEQLLEAALQKAGLENVALIAYDPLDNDMMEEASKMVSNQPDVLFQASAGNDLAAFVPAYVQSKYVPQAIMCYSQGFWSKEFLSQVGKAGVDYYLGCMVRPDLLYSKAEGGSEDSKSRATMLFAYINSLYKTKANTDMDSNSLLEFASVMVAVQAVAEAGTTDKQAIITALHEKTFEAPYLYSGAIAFDENGQNSIMPAYISRITSGRYAYEY